ncbi:TRAP transporter large permease subunit [Thalassospira sp. GB04J01]|uniref:TRAP transporter large permease subunit n=1 Tax=Thalassospira sp. GB04J01 TaxID=1485225 RepID=UPI0024471A58|nr:TRAP transporter large permease subunit [Thalassospira sp. GB04J01]
MDPLLLAAIVGIATTVVLFSGIPVGIGLLLVSLGFIIVFDGTGSLPLLPEILFGKLESFEVLAIPMFILMGAVVASSRAGGDLYSVLDRWLTRVPGGLVISNLGACAIFSALSGSSPATCAAIGKMGIPAMRERGFPDTVAAGSIAAGGTLGILTAKCHHDCLWYLNRNIDRTSVPCRSVARANVDGTVYGLVAVFNLASGQCARRA